MKIGIFCDLHSAQSCVWFLSHYFNELRAKVICLLHNTDTDPVSVSLQQVYVTGQSDGSCTLHTAYVKFHCNILNSVQEFQ